MSVQTAMGFWQPSALTFPDYTPCTPSMITKTARYGNVSTIISITSASVVKRPATWLLKVIIKIADKVTKHKLTKTQLRAYCLATRLLSAPRLVPTRPDAANYIPSENIKMHALHCIIAT